MKKMLLLAMAVGVSMAAVANTQGMRQVKVDATPSQSQAMNLRVADQKAAAVNRIVSQKVLGNGYSLNVVSDVNGKLRKVLNKNNAPKLAPKDFNSVVPMAKGRISTMAEGDGVALSEGFEGYDGVSKNWVPEGWTLEATESLLGSSYTWGGRASILVSSYEGDYTMGITPILSDEDNEAGVEEQNEWLITPSFTVEEYQSLNFYAAYTPLFMFDINGMDFVNMTFSDKKCAYTVRVYASVNNGEWVELYDLFSDFENMDFLDLLIYYSDLNWWHYQIDLDDYVGKNIRLAFQYQGMYGDSFNLDAVSVSTPHPQACYQRPGGAYYLGMDEEYYSLNGSFMFAAPYADLTWTNTSNTDSQSFVWTYTDPETGEEGVSTNVDLTVNYPYENGSVGVPSLTAYAEGATESAYAWNGDGILMGGSCLFSFSDGSISRYGVSTADVDNNKFTRIVLDDDGTMAFGFNPKSRELWTPVFGMTQDENNYVEVTEIGNLFPAPEVPYSLERVYVLGAGSVEAGTTINMTIRAVDESGYLRDTIATGHITGSEVVYPMSSDPQASDYFSMGFDILQQDDFGFEMPAVIAVNSAIYVAITVENLGNSNFGFFQTAYPSANNETNGYFRVVGKSEGEDVNSLQSINGLSTSSGPCYNSFLFYLTASYDVMHCDESTTFVAADGGESKTFNVVSNYATAGWTVTKSDRSADWFTYSLADGTDGVNSTVTFNVDALPAGVEGRSCDVTISVSPSAYLTFTISQGNSGVESTVVSSAAKVNVVNGDFVIAAPESINAVSVYNIAGQLVNTAAVEGTTTVDGASLAQGVYILKFNDGSSVKVIK